MMLSALLLYYHYNKLELSYSAKRLSNQAFGAVADIEDAKREVADGGAISVEFEELTVASANPKKREFYEGRTTLQKGLFAPLNEKQFTVFRLKMTCCASDAIPLKLRILAPEPLSNVPIDPGQGVEATGQIQFRKVADREEYVPVIVVKSMSDIRPVEIGREMFVR